MIISSCTPNQQGQNMLQLQDSMIRPCRFQAIALPFLRLDSSLPIISLPGVPRKAWPPSLGPPIRATIRRVEWWPIFWLAVVLKIPLLAALGVVWWALRAEPSSTEDERIDRGGRGPDHPRPRRPRPPRRGPHAVPEPSSPRRVRARSRRAVTLRR
jgi:hypothetical protein